MARMSRELLKRMPAVEAKVPSAATLLPRLTPTQLRNVEATLGYETWRKIYTGETPSRVRVAGLSWVGGASEGARRPAATRSARRPPRRIIILH